MPENTGQDTTILGGALEGGGEALQLGQEQQGTTPQAPNTTPQDQATNQQGQGETAKTLDAATQYEKFTVPEGFDYNDGSVNEFAALARELNLNQDQAQKLVDMHVRHWLGFEEQTRAQQEKWRDEAMNDPEFGGQKFTQSLADAMKFINVFGGDKLRVALEQAGVGNHPAFFVAFAKAGRLLGEDRMVTGSAMRPGGSGTFEDLANSMYPDMKNGGNN